MADRLFEYQGYTLPLFNDWYEKDFVSESVDKLVSIGATHVQINPFLWQRKP